MEHIVEIITRKETFGMGLESLVVINDMRVEFKIVPNTSIVTIVKLHQ